MEQVFGWTSHIDKNVRKRPRVFVLRRVDFASSMLSRDFVANVLDFICCQKCTQASILSTYEVKSTPDSCYADMAELADAPDLGSGGRPCRFDSCYPHYNQASRLTSTLYPFGITKNRQGIVPCRFLL